MQTHVLYRHRKHLIEDHGWEPDKANAITSTQIHDEQYPECSVTAK